MRLGLLVRVAAAQVAPLIIWCGVLALLSMVDHVATEESQRKPTNLGNSATVRKPWTMVPLRRYKTRDQEWIAAVFGGSFSRSCIGTAGLC